MKGKKDHEEGSSFLFFVGWRILPAFFFEEGKNPHKEGTRHLSLQQRKGKKAQNKKSQEGIKG